MLTTEEKEELARLRKENRENGAPVITSYGADGEPGGEGDALDLVSNRPQGVRRQ